MKKSELRWIIREEIKRINEKSFKKMSKDEIHKIWASKDLEEKKKLLGTFIDNMTGNNSKLKVNLEKIKRLDKLDTFATNIYLHSQNLGTGEGTSQNTSRKRKGYIANKKKEK